MFGYSWWAELLVFAATILSFFYAKYKLVVSHYWEKRGFEHLKPKFFGGNFLQANFTQNFGVMIANVHLENKAKKLVGGWLFSIPVLFATDVGIIKNILVKDFNYFHDRGITINEEVEPLTGHLFNMAGSKWRNLRVKLTPTFTSGKMKMMFPTMVKCGQELQDYLKVTVKDKNSLEIKELLARFTTDIISSCAFGIESNSLKNPDSEFRKYGRKIFEPTWWFIFINMLTFIFPFIDKIVWLRRTPGDLEDFFLNAVKDTMEYRDKNKVQRKDFMQLLIELQKKGKIEDADAKHHELDAKEDTMHEEQKFTTEQAAAQAFVFFIAGFETSSTTMMFSFYELAMDQDIQRKLQDEIDEVLRRHDKQITYEAIGEMEYLDWVVSETLRKYPPVPILFRVCTKDYLVPNTNAKIEKGTPVWISLLGLQRDPDIYPDPEKFDPDRFSPAETAKRDHYSNIPFGEGPRICIGNRFGLLQTKVGLISILSKFNVIASEKTPAKLEFDIKSFVLTPHEGMPLKIVPRDL